MKKLIAILTLLALTLSVLVSCNSGASQTETEDVSESETAYVDPELAQEIAEIDEYVDQLASTYNFNGADFVYVGQGTETPREMNETGNIESDALYYRVRELEEKFNIKFSHYDPPTLGDGGEFGDIFYAVNQEVMAGGDAYDLINSNPICIGQPLLVNNTLLDVSNFTVLDLDRPWWTQSLRDTYSIGGAVYFLNGAITTTYFRDAYCVLLNKNVANNYGIDKSELYSLVKNGEWTFDKMIEIAETIPTNESNSGVYRYASPNGLSILYGCGASLTKFDENGIPYIDSQLPKKTSDIADKFSTIMGDDTISANLKGYLVSEHESIEDKYGYKNFNEMFEAGKILFMFGNTDIANELRSHEVEFGILPIPKGSASQENYVSYCDPWGYVNVSVPKCTKNVDVTDVIVEAMGALGTKYIKPAYYDKLLKNRSTHDRDSKDMIDIIFETKVYDMMDLLGVGNSNSRTCDMINVVNDAIEESSMSFASRFMMQAIKTNMNIEIILQNIENDKK